MELSDQEYCQRVNEWLEAKGVKGTCLCGKRQWEAARPAYAPFVNEHGLFDVEEGAGGKAWGYMIVPVYCRNCGFMLMFNGCMLGLQPLPVEDLSGAPNPM